MVFVLLTFISSVLNPYANAALGARATFKSDATLSVPVTHDKYVVHEAVNGSSKIRQYATPDGTVFAVTWTGMVHPDLSELLGEHYDEYDKVRKSTHRRKGRACHSVKTSKAVVEHGGHMRAVRGRAYVPGLIPAGVSLNEIR